MTDRQDDIRRLNDEFRTGEIPHSQLHETPGVKALGDKVRLALLDKVRTFTDFTPGNDPHGEHDFGNVEIAGERCYWKIDYYDRSLTGHSPDAADPEVTIRILTVMLVEEY